ncbi:hypothetical protein AB0I55_07175 [Actinocatenispora sera]|uniref:hypothetical protein n=1 Tax=Actinocatenispora sera TaxID=390989 RepID=UPI0033D04925
MHTENRPGRVLVVGRSPHVLLDTVDALRALGYAADATNQFDRVLDEYDGAELDVLVFGGMVPADTKQRLRASLLARNPRVVFVQGLAGIPGLVAAQVQAATATEAPAEQIGYDPAGRAVQLTLGEARHVTVQAWWMTSFAPPEPRSTTLRVFDGDLGAGAHTVQLPDPVPDIASFAGVTVGAAVRVFTVGEMPRAVTRLAPNTAADDRLPPVDQVSTGHRDG